MAKPCRYCQSAVVLLKHGAPGYPYARNRGPVWVCLPCDAWVGCHPGTDKALGGVANAELRAAKQAAHAAFDPLWRRKILRDKCSKSKARKAGYRWLSEQLGIPYEQTHIGYFDVDQCRRVVEVCTELKCTSSINPPEKTMTTEARKYPESQAYSEKPRPAIALVPVDSSQVGAVGYDEASKTLAVQFKHGAKAIYHYPNVEPETHAAFMVSESKGVFFKEHIRALAFEKFAAEPEEKSETSEQPA